MGGQISGLLRLRASPPAVPPGFVDRPRLEERLTAAAALPVTLLSAGPGYGKTLTVASWAVRCDTPGRVAWLSVDDTDNDLQAFWSDVLGALEIVGALPSGSALRELAPASGFSARELLLVRAGLTELTGVVTLVLDDFHLITDGRVLESVGQLLEQQPPQLRLVLVSRFDPTLRLHRLRIRGDLTDIRAGELAFTRVEATELLHRNRLHPSTTQLDVLLERTQGWAAGLRLAIMCLDPSDVDRGIAGFTGRDRLVAEYLIEEVSDRLPAADRQFLLTTSIADRVSAALANELTGRSDGQFVLERLANHNSLVLDLDGSNEWFRFHPMLRDLLLHHLALEQPGAVSDLHLRACRWFAAQGEPIQAIRHATAGQHWAETGRLLADIAWPEVLTPNGPALVAALEPAVARARTNPTTGTLLACAVRDLHRRDFDSMIRATNDAEQLLTDVPGDDGHAAEALIALLRVAHSRVRNPAMTALSAGRLLRLLDRPPLRHLPTARQHRLIATNNLAVGQLWAGDLDSAATTLSMVQARGHDLGLSLTELSAHAHLALLDVIHGRLPDALSRTAAAQEVANRRGWTAEPQALGLFAALAMIHLEQGRVDMAATVADSGLATSRSGSDAACRVALAITEVGVAVARKDPAAAGAAAQQLDTIMAQAGDLPPMLARWCTVAHANAHLATGEPHAAIALIEDGHGDSGFTWAQGLVTLARARLMLDQPDAAMDLLDPTPTLALPYRGTVVEARILTAVAADRMHRDTAALAAIAEAIDLAQDDGIRRPFRAAGQRTAGLVARHRHLVARHLDFTRTLVAIDGDTSPVATLRTVESLTERELAVLSYLPTMLKSAEIASDLYVTVHTVKSHTRSIYRKLGVNTRRNAVDKARALKLL